MSEQLTPVRLYIDAQLVDAALALVDGSSIDDMVTFCGTGDQVSVVPATSYPVESWSSGERRLWDVLASLNGSQSVSLYELANRFRGDPRNSVCIAKAIALMLGVEAAS